MKFIHFSLFMVFIFCTLIHVTLIAGNGPILKGQNFNGTILCDVNFEEGDLEGCSFICANLKGANLKKAKLTDANLNKAILEHADLEGADLEYANLEDCDLRNTNLRHAKLFGANLKGAKLFNTCLDCVSFQKDNLKVEGKRPKCMDGTSEIYSVKHAPTLKDKKFKEDDLQHPTLVCMNIGNTHVCNKNLREIPLEAPSLKKTILKNIKKLGTNFKNICMYFNRPSVQQDNIKQNINAERDDTNETLSDTTKPEETLTHSTESESDDCTIEDKGPNYRAYVCENGEESYREPNGTLNYSAPYDANQKNLSYGIYKKCKIKNKNFNNKNLSHSTFKSCDIFISNFMNTNLDDVKFIDCMIDSCTFIDCSLKRTSFTHCTLKENCFKNAILDNVTILKGNIQSADMFKDAKKISMTVDDVFLFHQNELDSLKKIPNVKIIKPRVQN